MGANAVWLSLAEWRKGTRSGLISVPKRILNVDPNGARARLDDGLNWDRTLRVLASLGAYRTMTAEQLAFSSGVATVGTGRSALMSDLFSLGLVDIGEYPRPFATSANARANTIMYRPSRTRSFDANIAPRCTYEEWVSVTGGLGWDSSGQYDRHNILTTELALRAVELLPQVSATLGERQSSASLLAYESVGTPAPPAAARRSADATLLRGDGMRIAVELTASTGAFFDTKVERWAQMLSTRRYNDTGLVVVFLLAPNSDVKGSTKTHSLRRAVSHSMRKASGLYRGLPNDPTYARMYLATWEEWFPDRGTASREFLYLSAGQMASDDQWLPTSLMDASTFPGPSNPDLRRGLSNLAGLRQTPAWSLPKLGQAPELWRYAAASSPVQTGESFNPEPVGAFGTVRPPERMLPSEGRGVSAKRGPALSAKMEAAS